MSIVSDEMVEAAARKIRPDLQWDITAAGLRRMRWEYPEAAMSLCVGFDGARTKARAALTAAMVAIWRSADTAPENGDEFTYLRADGTQRIGSLGHDMGGSIRRDPTMTHWHPLLPPPEPR